MEQKPKQMYNSALRGRVPIELRLELDHYYQRIMAMAGWVILLAQKRVSSRKQGVSGQEAWPEEKLLLEIRARVGSCF